MKQYQSRLDAPLKFHKFYWYIYLPIQFLRVLGMLFSTDLQMKGTFSWIYGIDSVFFIASLGLILACFIGFFRWKPYAWYSMMILLSVSLGYAWYTIFLYAALFPELVSTAIGQMIGVSIHSVLVGIYYIKRRPLFFADDEWTLNQESGKTPGQKEEFCLQCGQKLREESSFCSYCGTPVRREK